MKDRQQRIRNFSIIAHIDHGKSTLADRILELTHAVEAREMKTQYLDNMDLEQERGITIKLNAVELTYSYLGEDYIFHLIDTPGHVDFAYEVSRSLAACEGAILVVDASQGVEAQTLANLFLALDNNLEIIPVINKIDLPNADVAMVQQEIEEIIGLPADDIPLISAKSGLNIESVLQQIIERVPAPLGDANAPLQALIFDSYYDAYRGVIPQVRIMQGTVKKGDAITMLATGATFEVVEVGTHTPKETKRDTLGPGDVGYLTAAIRSVKHVRVGDTVTHTKQKAAKLPGYREMKPMVYCGLFPTDASKYEDVREAIERLQLNDAALVFEPETSQALGFGFRVGFLGLLHMDIVQERLEREFKLDIITTAPSVIYRVTLTDGTVKLIENPSQMPEVQKLKQIEEPMVTTTLFTPNDSVGVLMELCQAKRGTFIDLQYLDVNRVQLRYELPLSEIIFDFFDKLKSYTKGYASFDYELKGYMVSPLVKMDILLNGEIVDALSTIVHKDFAYKRGHAITVKLKNVIPQQLFEVPVQAAIGSKIIARTNIKAMRKNVLAKCYGGDITRKKKLLEKQKEGKKRMKSVGNVEVPQEAFMAVLSIDED
jgi:GTP-binding protein LepA